VTDQVKKLLCKHAEDPTYPGECEKIADPQYTMDFTDCESGAYIYWCSACGPGAHRIDRALRRALETRGVAFVRKAQRLIEEAENESKPS